MNWFNAKTASLVFKQAIKCANAQTRRASIGIIVSLIDAALRRAVIFVASL